IEKQMVVIANSVTELRSAFGKLQSDSVHPSQVMGLKSAIEQNYQEVVSKLDSLGHSGIDPNAYAQAVEASHANILEQVKKIGDSFSSAIPSSDAFTGLEATYRIIAEKIEKLDLSVSGLNTDQNMQQIAGQFSELHSLIEKLEKTNNNSVTPDLSTIEMRLEEVARAVTALSSADHGTDNLERIEARVIELSRELGALTSKDTSAGTTGDQLGNLDLSGLETYFSETSSALKQLETRIATQPNDSNPQLEKMAAEVRKLGDKVDNISAVSAGSASDGVDNPALIERLNELVERVEQIRQAESAAHNNDASETLLNSLHEQVAGISAQLENFPDGAHSMDVVTQSLTSIEQQLGASRDISIELAATAAEEALRRVIHEIPGSESSAKPEAFEALQQDIRGLHEALNGTEDVHFEELKTTLGGLDERLESIEFGIEQISSKGTVVPTAHSGQYQEDAYIQAPVAQTPMSEPSQPETVEQSTDEEFVGQAEINQSLQSPQSPVENPPVADTHEQNLQDASAASAGEQLVKAARHAEQERVNTAKRENDSLGVVSDLDDLSGSLAAHAHSLAQVPAPELSPDLLPEQGFTNGDDTPYELAHESFDNEDMALEPGSPGPDLEALVRQANERRKTLATRGEALSGTDFLAQARQAAQAAAMEASAVEAEGQKEVKAKSKSLLASIPSLLSRKKKAMIIAAAAALLVAVAVPIINKYALSSNVEQVSTVAALDENDPAETPAVQLVTDNDQVSRVIEVTDEIPLPIAENSNDQLSVSKVSLEHTASVPEVATVDEIDLYI
ncbi:MAG: hypothetical protein AAF412_07810, partial [Pseudomonadota bacterium]